MIWKYKTRRCIRRFALIPRKVYFKNSMNTWVFWLQFYYIIQNRIDGFWITDSGCSKETWLNWKGD